MGGKGFFQELKEERSKREIIAVSQPTDRKVAYVLTVAVNAIFYSYESIAGIEVADLKDDKVFQALNSTVARVRKEFQINSETRLGLRILYFSQVSKTRDIAQEQFRHLIDAPLIDVTERTLGAAADYAIVVDGKEKEDSVAYHLRMGPFRGADEQQLYLQTLNAEFVKDSAFDFMCDLDQYERKTRYGAELAIWRPYLKRAEAWIRDIEGRLTGKVGHGNRK